MIESVLEGSHSELLDPNTAYLVRMDLPFSDENFGSTNKVVVNIGWMDWEAWLRDDDRAILSLMQEFHCLHHLYLREPAHRAKSLDDVLTAKLRKIQPGNDIYIGLTELGFPKIISVCQGSLLVVGMPAIKAVEHFESEDLLELVSSTQKASADEIIDNGGCFSQKKNLEAVVWQKNCLLTQKKLEAAVYQKKLLTSLKKIGGSSLSEKMLT